MKAIHNTLDVQRKMDKPAKLVKMKAIHNRQPVFLKSFAYHNKTLRHLLTHTCYG